MKLKLYLTFSMLVLTSVVFAQAKKTITGSVKDTEGLPLIGATIVLEGTDFGTSADDNGIFTISAGEGDVLVVSYVFYETQKIRITSKTHYDVRLKEDGQVLDDVVVVAYGTSSKEAITGAVVQVGSDAIAKRPSTNALGALEGAAAGISVNNSSGQPGSEPDIRIRGFTSLRSQDANRPLIVLDGAPYNGNISDINPSDIENMSVLKDASSSTLYGSRASNGVILITTKKGKGKGQFNVSVKNGLYNRATKEYDTMGITDFMNTSWTGYRNSLMDSKTTMEQASAIANEKLIPNYLGLNIFNRPDNQLFVNGKLDPNAEILQGYLGDLDWYKPVERTGYYSDVNMNGRVSNEKGGAYFSAGLLNNDSYFKSSDFKRFTGRVNADYQVKEWLKVGGNISATQSESRGVNADPDADASYTNPFMFARNIAPIYPVHLHDRKTGEYVYDELGNMIYDNGDTTRKQYIGRHVIWENELNSQKTINTTVNGSFFADIKFLDDFTFTLRGDMNLRNEESRKYDNAIVGDGKGNQGRSRRDTYRWKTYTAQQLLNWNKSFGDHALEVLLGHENYSTERNYLYGMKTTQTFAGMDHLINFNNTSNLYDYETMYRTEGYLSRAKYNYANKYFIEGSFRRDGSSKFQKDNRWGNFWSVGGSWVLTNEEFFKIKEIDYAKLRVSYGEVGNDRGASTYAYQDLYSISKNGGETAIYKSQAGNPDLQWETSSSFNIGLDANVFKRANFTIEYFDKSSQNLLFDLNMPLSYGATTTSKAESVITSNVGSISNRGIELSVSVDVIKNQDWKWNVSANATWLKNKITELPAENREKGIISGTMKRMEGRSIYDFYMYQFVGVDQMTGNALYEIDYDKYYTSASNAQTGKTLLPTDYLVNINGQEYTTYTTYGRKDWSGSAIPKMEGSFSTNVSYKNFSLGALFTYRIGGKVLDYSYVGLMSPSATSPKTLHTDLLNAWNGVPEGMTANSPNRIDPNGIPVIDFARSTYTTSTSNRFLKDGSYLTVKSINLNYDFPSDLTRKLDVSSISMNLGIENLYTFTKLRGMNPQQSFTGIMYNAYVPPRTIIFGINVGF
ncbi:SusC/RagA family TonB-linked outer membrane protein [Myroides sp. N17-2]|uniref:SusC/RagA family TonB-linked outer membrane protein n=1 Tax=Myroides sp. N17-2 TaxID=2030799 RepID=UPI000EFD7BBA|nr:SusC/RagA family TonB-linked outer membrane protein [Myroides sp. N17-2]